MPTFSFSSSNPLELALQPENGSTPLRAETSHAWTGCRKRTTIVAAEKPVTTVLWRRKTFEVQGQLQARLEARSHDVYRPRPMQQLKLGCLHRPLRLYARFRIHPRIGRYSRKSTPATLMIADDFSGSDTALTALILPLYSQEWFVAGIDGGTVPEGACRKWLVGLTR
ncbi:hypothetical protein K525DRAFT_251620 [Schizophyllum commune Loenen D]|nr:hypothetical protein K525DRAFT_251620 [Schizophyllum commune Loenen D]